MNPSQMMNVWDPFQKHPTQTSSEIVHSTTNVDIRMINNRNIMDTVEEKKKEMFLHFFLFYIVDDLFLKWNLVRIICNDFVCVHNQ